VNPKSVTTQMESAFQEETDLEFFVALSFGVFGKGSVTYDYDGGLKIFYSDQHRLYYS